MSQRKPLDRQSDVGWRTAARAMKAADPDRSNGSIAREIGVNPSQVWRLFNPGAARAIAQRDNAKRSKAKRSWENENDRGTCERCGATTCVGHARRTQGRWCADCHAALQREARLQRAREIERLWAAGTPTREIAAALDTTPGYIGVEINRLRREGLADLPYRYAMANGRRTVA